MKLTVVLQSATEFHLKNSADPGSGPVESFSGPGRKALRIVKRIPFSPEHQAGLLEDIVGVGLVRQQRADKAANQTVMSSQQRNKLFMRGLIHGGVCIELCFLRQFHTGYRTPTSQLDGEKPHFLELVSDEIVNNSVSLPAE